MALLSLKIKNYFSFKEGVEVSFKFGKKVSKNIGNGLTFTTAICVKGANASGKTNILKGLVFLSEFIVKSFDKKKDDEIDMNLHPHILPKIINLFIDPKINKNNAQIIFTTHDEAIMDYITKYRIFLVNKENNESYGYRLDEISDEVLRNDRKITPIYNKGSIGGVPRL